MTGRRVFARVRRISVALLRFSAGLILFFILLWFLNNLVVEWQLKHWLSVSLLTLGSLLIAPISVIALLWPFRTHRVIRFVVQCAIWLLEAMSVFGYY